MSYEVENETPAQHDDEQSSDGNRVSDSNNIQQTNKYSESAQAIAGIWESTHNTQHTYTHKQNEMCYIWKKYDSFSIIHCFILVCIVTDGPNTTIPKKTQANETNKKTDSDWKQLRCHETKLVFSRVWVFAVFGLIAATFIPIGVLVFNLSEDV